MAVGYYQSFEVDSSIRTATTGGDGQRRGIPSDRIKDKRNKKHLDVFLKVAIIGGFKPVGNSCIR